MTDNKYRCVVTGLGMITSIGDDVNTTWDKALHGVSGTKEITSVPTEGCYAKLASEVHTDLSDCSNGKYLGRATLLAIHALKEAMNDSGLTDFENNPRVSCIIGNCVAGVDAIENYYTKGKETKEISQMPMSAIASEVAGYCHAGGVVTTIANACAAGTISIAYACDLIRDNKADIVVCGGTDAFASVPYAGFLALHAMDSNICSSFNHTTGINLGEGSGILIVESYEHALKRKAKMYAEVLGSGVTTDAHHITAPRDDGLCQIDALNRAIDASGIKPSDIGYVNAHGTGTHKNDYAEFLSLKTVFGEDDDKLSVSSTKPMVGHCLGAAGSIEAIFCIKAMNDGILPPTLGFAPEDMDQLHQNAGKIDFVPNVAEKKSVDYVMNNSFAFGGNNASIIFSKHPGDVKVTKNEDKIVLTGFGIVSPLGNSLEGYIKNYHSHIEGNNVHSTVSKVDFDALNIPMSVYRKWDTISQMETASGVYALKNAGIIVDSTNERNIGIVDGTAEGAMGMGCLFEETLAEKGNAAGSAFKFPNTVYNAAAGYLSIFTCIKGYNVTICNGAQSGLASLAYGMNIIENGKEDVVLTSGSDENISVTSELFTQIGLVADQYVEPYSNGKGFVLSDGAISAIMETKSHAEKRKAKVYCSVLGYGLTHHDVKFPTLKGSSLALDEAITQALDQAHIQIEDVDMISGFACGDRDIDTEEISSYRRVFKDRLDSLPILAVKKKMGEGRAATALLSAVDAALLLSDTIDYDDNAYLVSEEGIRNTTVHSKDLHYVLVTSYGMGGSYAAVVLARE